MKAPLVALDRAFEELYASLPDLLSHTFLEEQEAQKSIPLQTQGRQRLTHELSLEISTLRQRCRNGLKLILEKLHSIHEPDVAPSVAFLEKELSTRLYKILSSPSFTQIVLKVVSGQSWREALQFPKDSLELLYKGAKSFFEEGCFTEATDCFSFLSWFDARQYDFWMALGHSQFHCANHSSAISSYGLASHCISDDSWPHTYSASCFEAIGEYDQAVECITQSLDIERHKELLDQGLILALEHKLALYRQGSVTPIS